MTSDITQQQRLSNKIKRKEGAAQVDYLTKLFIFLIYKKCFVYQNQGENFKRRSTFNQSNQRKTGNGPCNTKQSNTKQETLSYSQLRSLTH